jgi:hypothetical protein
MTICCCHYYALNPIVSGGGGGEGEGEGLGKNEGEHELYYMHVESAAIEKEQQEIGDKYL